MAKWLDKYEQGGLVLKKKTKDNYGKKPNVNDVNVSAGPNFVGEGYTAYNWKSPAWGGQFQMGGSLPGSVGFTYARTQNPAPSNGKYAKKTKASAQSGKKLIDFGFSSPETDNVYEGDVTFFNPKDFTGIKNKVENYMRSDTYLNRLKNYIPDEQFARRVRDARANSVESVRLSDTNPQNEIGYYGNDRHPGMAQVNADHSIRYNDKTTRSILAHELGHAAFRGLLTDQTDRFDKSALILNPNERQALLSGLKTEELYKTLGSKANDEHYTTGGGKWNKGAPGETYGDLTGLRLILNDSGITKKFGDELTPEMFKKALENPKTKNDPALKRMKMKFSDEDIIRMNNSVAGNNSYKSNQAQSGIKVPPLDPQLKNINLTKEHKQAAEDAKTLSRKEYEEKYKQTVYNDYKKWKNEDVSFYDNKIQNIQKSYDSKIAKQKAAEEAAIALANKQKAEKLEEENFRNQYSSKQSEFDKFKSDILSKYKYTPGEQILSPHEAIVKRMTDEANKAIETGIGYDLPQLPGNEMTCINGVCEIASTAGVDFSGMEGVTGVRKNPYTGKLIPQYNAGWAANDNYKKAGYIKLLPGQRPQAGDLAQYTDDGKIHHMELILGADEKGLDTYNNYQQTLTPVPGAGKARRSFKDGPNKISEIGVENTSYYRLDPTVEQKIYESNPEYRDKIKGKQQFESSDDFKKYNELQNYIKQNADRYNKIKKPSAQNGIEMKFYQEGLDFKPKTISQNGLLMNFEPEKMRSDATRVAAPVRPLTKKEKEKNIKANKEVKKRTEERNQAIIEERKNRRETKGDVNVPGSFNIAEKFRLFPESVGGLGEMFDEYINPAFTVGALADALGESTAAKDPKAVAATLAMTAGLGALGFDPLGSAIKAQRFSKGALNNLGYNVQNAGNPFRGKGMPLREIDDVVAPRQDYTQYIQERNARNAAFDQRRAAIRQSNTERVPYQFPTDEELLAMNLREAERYAPRASRLGRQPMATPDDMTALNRSTAPQPQPMSESLQRALRDIDMEPSASDLDIDFISEDDLVAPAPRPSRGYEITDADVAAMNRDPVEKQWSADKFRIGGGNEPGKFVTKHPEGHNIYENVETYPSGQVERTYDIKDANAQSEHIQIYTRQTPGDPYVDVRDVSFFNRDPKSSTKQMNIVFSHLPEKARIEPISTSIYSQPLLNTRIAKLSSGQPGRIKIEPLDRMRPLNQITRGRGYSQDSWYDEVIDQFPKLERTYKTINEYTGANLEMPYLRYKNNPITLEQFKSPEFKRQLMDEGNSLYDVDVMAHKYKTIKNWKNGGQIVDPMGQWAHPGEITTIPSNDITMKGVNYDVLGISNTGDKKLMKPGKNYKFDGDYVTEYPKGGWLNKYK